MINKLAATMLWATLCIIFKNILLLLLFLFLAGTMYPYGIYMSNTQSACGQSLSVV